MNTGWLCLECGSRQVDIKLVKLLKSMPVEAMWVCRKCGNTGGCDLNLLDDTFDFRTKTENKKP